MIETKWLNNVFNVVSNLKKLGIMSLTLISA